MHEKGKEKKNNQKKKLVLFNKPNSTRSPSILNINLSSKEINKNKKIDNIKSNKTTKTLNIFLIEKIPRKKVKNINNNNNNSDIQNSPRLNFIFENEQNKISCAGEYLEEIYYNLLIEEEKSKIKPKMGYMINQIEINEQMRAILFDWIIEVHYQFNLRPETLFMTTWIIDTFLSFHSISRKDLQLLGIACLLISCKSEEIYFPPQNKFLEVADGAYTREEMLKMENEILKKLSFNIVFPKSNNFFDIISKLFNFDTKQYYLGKYFIESSLIDYNMIKYSGSVISASCAYLVMKYFGKDGYQKLYSNFIIYENNPENIIKDAAKEIYEFVEKISKSNLNSVKNKYALDKYEKVSEIFKV